MTNTDMDTLEFYWRCIEADMELSGTPLLPEDVVMSYCGNGASATVTAGEMRRHLRQYRETLERVRELEALLKEAMRIASDDDNAVFNGDLRYREAAIVRWKASTRAALGKHGEGV